MKKFLKALSLAILFTLLTLGVVYLRGVLSPEIFLFGVIVGVAASLTWVFYLGME